MASFVHPFSSGGFTTCLIAILFVAAFVLFVLAALSVPSSRIGLGWTGATCAALAWLIANWPK